MALNVISNFAANVAQRNLSISDRDATRSVAKLSSGTRVLAARDDAASLAIGSRLRAEVGALRQANVNAGQASSLLQVADGALSTIGDILVRMKTLAVQSASGNLGGVERGAIQLEFNALQSEIDRIAQDTEFNGVQLINGEEEIVTRIGDDNVSGTGADLRVVNNLIGADNGVEAIEFSDNFDPTMAQINYSSETGTFTVTDLSQAVGSAAGRTATGVTRLPMVQGAATNLLPGEIETVKVTFDEGGANERSVSITINSDFSKSGFGTLRPEANMAQLTADDAANFGAGAADVFTVNSYGGDLAGLGNRITATADSTVAAVTLTVANAYGEDLVSQAPINLGDDSEHTVRLQNSQGDFIDITIDLDAALTDGQLTSLKSATATTSALTLSGLNGEGNDLHAGTLAVENPNIAADGTIARLIANGDLVVREIGGSASTSPVRLGYDADNGTFDVTVTGVGINTVTANSTALTGRAGEFGRATAKVGDRTFEITVSSGFNRGQSISHTQQVTEADDLVAVGSTGIGVEIIGYGLGADQTVDDLLRSLSSNSELVITGGDNDTDGDVLTVAWGDFTGGTPGDINDGNSAELTVTQAGTGNSINFRIVNSSGEDIVVGDDGVVTDDADLDGGETITVAFNGFSNTVFTQSSAVAQASFDISQVSGDLSGLDNRIRIAKGASGRELTEATLSIANSNTERGDLTGTADLTRTGAQRVELKNSAGDTVMIVLNQNAAFTEEQLDRRGTSGETFLLLGQLDQSAIYGRSSKDEREFVFKVGSGAEASDDVAFSVRSANADALGVNAEGPNAIRVDGADATNADVASTAISEAIERLNNARSIVGAGQNRLEFASNSVAAAIENAEAARSTLIDLDVSAEISVYTSKQILVQTGISILAQANQQPQQLLRLFQ